MNFKGVGEGIKKNVEETATKAAKGVVKAAVEGIKESVQVLKRTKSDDAANSPYDE